MGESRSFIPFFLLSCFVPQEVGTLLQVHVSRPPDPTGYSRYTTPLVVLFSKTASLNYMSLTSLPSFLPSQLPLDKMRAITLLHSTSRHATPQYAKAFTSTAPHLQRLRHPQPLDRPLLVDHLPRERVRSPPAQFDGFARAALDALHADRLRDAVLLRGGQAAAGLRVEFEGVALFFSPS